MAFASRPLCHTALRYVAPSLHIQTRHASHAVEATQNNINRLLPEQLQYGKPNKPSPPRTHLRLDQIHANIPAYPHPRRYWYKKANLGLYGTLSIRSGNTVSKQNEHKHKRVWRPNVHHKRLWSEGLQRFIRIKVVTRVIRTIDKVGGLDSYLLGNRKGRIRELGMGGWALRWRVARTPGGRARIMAERKAMGLEGEPAWMGLPFAVKWLAAHEAKAAKLLDGGVSDGIPQLVSGLMVKEVTEDAAATDLERMIDAEFDADDEAAARGEEGGIDLDTGIESEDDVKR